MNRYEMKTPKTAIGVAAAVMTVLILGLAVVVPAKMGHDDQNTVAAANAGAAHTEVAINPSQLEIVGVRQQSVASATKAAHIDLVGVRPQELAAAGTSSALSE